MEEELKIWPAFVLLKPNELLSCWIVRLAHSHGLNILEFAELFFNVKKLGDIDCGIDGSIVKKLSQRTGIAEADIKAAILGKEEKVSKWVLNIGTVNRNRNRYGLMYCPSCLNSDGSVPYYRQNWRLGSSFLCEECCCDLMDRCPSCDFPIILFSQELRVKVHAHIEPLSLCCYCRFDLSRGHRTYPRTYWTDLQKRINCLVGKGSLVTSHAISDEKVYTWATALGSGRREFIELEHWIAKELSVPQQSLRWNDTKGFLNLSVNQRRLFLAMADWLVTDWPDRLIYIQKRYRLAKINPSF